MQRRLGSTLEGSNKPDLGTSIAGIPLEEVSDGAIKSPLFSFVVINLNYAEYIGEAIDSIRAQTYPHFECIIVDNGSTDNSREVIVDHVGEDKRFKVRYLPENLGQLGAAQWTLDHISGDFVTFVDADDVLFPKFAAMHLQVHLSLPRSVALTSSNVIEIQKRGHILTGGYINFAQPSKNSLVGLRPPGTEVRLATISDAEYARLHAATQTIPHWVGGWIWAPGTSNTFRRSVLRMATIGKPNEKLIRATDAHINHMCHALGGTALIDIPLVGYRQHGNNFFSTSETIASLRRGTRDHGQRDRAASRATLETLLERVDFFEWVLIGRYWASIDRLTRAAPDEIRKYFAHPETIEMFSRHIQKMRSVFDDDTLMKEIRKRYSFFHARRIFANGLAAPSAKFMLKFYYKEFMKLMSRLMSRTRPSTTRASNTRASKK